MKRLNRYNNFLIEQLLESILSTTPDFRRIISRIPEEDKIADTLYGIISNAKDVKTNYNFLDFSKDKNDEVSFIPDTQYQRIVTSGDDPKIKTKSNAKIGRMIGQILRDNGFNFSEKEIETFVNSYKALWNKMHNITDRKVSVVGGEEIKKWYNKKNYNSEKGTLGNSCMRYENVNDYMQIYADNPDKIKMVIITEYNKLLGRALIWNLDSVSDSQSNKIYLDRIYTDSDSDVSFILDWVLENVCGGDKTSLLAHHKEDDERFDMVVNLKNTTFPRYPYSDTFKYLFENCDDGCNLTGGGFVTNNWDENEKYPGFMVSELRNHSTGVKTTLSHVWSESLDRWILKKEAVQTRGGWTLKSECKFSKYLEIWIPPGEQVWSEAMQDWIPESEAYDSDKFGVVIQSFIVEIATEYLGKYENPLDVWRAVLIDGEYLFEKEEFLRGGDMELFSPEYRLGISKFFDKALLVKDIWGEWQIEKASLKLVRISNEMIKSIPPYLSYLTRSTHLGTYMIADDAELFGFSGQKEWIAVKDFLDYYVSDFNLAKIEEFIKSTNLSEERKAEIIENKKKIHNILLSTNSKYKSSWNVQNKTSNKTPVEVLEEWHKETARLFFTENWDKIWKEFVNEFQDNNLELEGESLKLVEESVKGMWDKFMLIYFVLDDTYESRDWVISIIQKNPKLFNSDKLRELGDPLTTIPLMGLLRSIFRENMDDFRRARHSVRIDLEEKWDLSPDDIANYTKGVKVNSEGLN